MPSRKLNKNNEYIPLGKGEVESSILSCSTINSPKNNSILEMASHAGASTFDTCASGLQRSASLVGEMRGTPGGRVERRSAIISDCTTYRYRLERDLGTGRGVVAGIMVNPSTADATVDDATIRKWIGFAERSGFRRIIIGNKFAFRATDVRRLRDADDPVGPANDAHLRQIMADADLVVVAWGPMSKLPPNLRDRWTVIAQMADDLGKPLHCYGIAQDGHPRHPLMLSYQSAMIEWRRPK